MSKSLLKAALDNRSNQQNPQHPVYYLSRGLDTEQAMRESRALISPVPAQPVNSLPVNAKRSAKPTSE
jgi:hypothetical protein